MIAYAILRLKIQTETTSEFESLRKELIALEEAIWGKDPNPTRAAKILESIVLNRGLEFQHLGRIDNPTVKELEKRMPPFCRALIRDIVRGTGVKNPVFGKEIITEIGASRSGKEWDPYEKVNKLARKDPRLLKSFPNLYRQYLEGRFEEAMQARDSRLLDDLPRLQEECRRQLAGDSELWVKAICYKQNKLLIRPMPQIRY